MNSFPSPGSAILKDASSKQLEQAVASNHHELFCLNAICQGGEVRTADGLTLTYCGPGKGAMVSFPSLAEDKAATQLDEMMDYFRVNQPKNVGCWSLDPPQPSDIGIKLLARGFQPGWHPCWMALDLEKIHTGHAVPPGLNVKADNSTSIDHVKNLPYAGDNGAMAHALMQAQPVKAKRFIATLHGKIVAHSCIFLTDGEYGTAGIYNVGVVPRLRKKGIGKAVVTAACLYAKEIGYRYAVLNATGRRMYEQIGFQWIADGLTWWLINNNYSTHPPSQKQIMIAEATGKGDTNTLDHLAKQFSAYEINEPITNGMTLLQLAVHCQQPASADWLTIHGAVYNALDAWDVGWKDRAAALLKADPKEINKQHTDWQTTLLHIAADRNDIALAELALSANPDLTIKDKIYNSTALDWAKHLQREEISWLIKNHLKNMSGV
ncbi:MAG: GNAT family N-acetyltransferase [Bacteroidota bacterium]|nr:GNAT family N-acetyltransferase [Bacteroidota bacterium]